MSALRSCDLTLLKKVIKNKDFYISTPWVLWYFVNRIQDKMYDIFMSWPKMRLGRTQKCIVTCLRNSQGKSQRNVCK